MKNNPTIKGTIDKCAQSYYYVINIPTRPLPQGKLNYGGFFILGR